jgi:predicted nucleic acid-binding protein
VIVVSDASPLIALAAVQQLDLLRILYGEILLPSAVYDEVTNIRPAAPGANEVRNADWIYIRHVENRTLVDALSLDLDVGEAEALSLAVEADADLLLMDERRGRIAAARLGRRVIGVLGVVAEAKATGLVPAVRPILDALAQQAGFHISAALRDRVLATAGE